MKKPPSKVAHNWPPFFSVLRRSAHTAQKWKSISEMCLKTHLSTDLWSISHVCEHEFYCLGHFGSPITYILIKYPTFKVFFFSYCQGQNKYEIKVTVGSALKSQVLGCECKKRVVCSINQLYIKLGCQLAKSQSITTCHWIKKRNLVASFRESESKFFWRIPLPARILIKCRQGGRSLITLARFCSFLTNYLTNLVSIYTK